MPNPSLADLDGDKPAAATTTTEPAVPELKPLVDQPAADLDAARQQQIADDAKKAADDDAAKKPEDADDNEPEGSVWDDVDALRGEKLDFEWKDDQGVIPEEERDTPRGILARERALEDRAVVRFEETIMQEDPRGYQYLLHRKAGGTDEDFFAQKTITLPDYDRFKESVDLQVKVYSDSLRNAGVGEKQIKQLTDGAVKDKEIFELADQAYKKQQLDESRSIEELNRQLEQERQYYQRSVVNLTRTIAEQVASKEMSIIVPEAKRAEFQAFVLKNIQYNEATRTFLFAQPIEPKQLPRMLEAMFLQYSGGDLNGLVRREAQTDNARRLRRSVLKSQQLIKTQDDNRPGKKTLGEL